MESMNVVRNDSSENIYKQLDNYDTLFLALKPALLV